MSKISKLPEVENPTGDEPAVVLADGITKRVSIAAVVRAAARWLLRDTARAVPDYDGREDVPVADRPYGLKRYVHADRREFIWSPAGDPDGLGGVLAKDGWVGLPNTEEASRLDLMHGGLAQDKVYGLPGTLDALRDVDASLAAVRIGDLRAELLAGTASVTWTRAGGRHDGQALAWGNWTVPLRGDVTRWDQADWSLAAVNQLFVVGNSLSDPTGAVDQWCQLLAAQMGWELVAVARGSSDARQVYKTGARPLMLTLAGPVPAGGSVAITLINDKPPNLDSDPHNGNPASWLNSYAGDPTPASDTGWASDGFTWRRVTVRIPRSDSTDYRVSTVDGSAWAVGAPVLFIPDVAQRRPGRLHALWPGNNTFFNGNAGPDGDHTSPEFWADLEELVRQTAGERAFILPISPESGWTQRGPGTPYDAWQATKARTAAKYPHLWLRDARGYDLTRYMQVEGEDPTRDDDRTAIAAGLLPISCLDADGVHLNNKGRKLVAAFVAAALPLQALPPRITLGDTVRLTATGSGGSDSKVAGAQIKSPGKAVERLYGFRAAPIGPVTQQRYFRWDNGAETEHASAAFRTALIDVEPGERLRISMTVNGIATAMAVLFDASGAYVGHVNRGGEVAVVYAGYEYVVPAGVRRIGLTGYTVDPVVERSVQVVTAELADRVGSAETRLADTDALRGLYAPAGTTLSAGYYNRTTGAVVANNGYRALSLVPVRAGQQIRVSGTALGGGMALAVFLDKTLAYVGRVHDGVDGVAAEFVDAVVAIPARAAFVAVTSYIGTSGRMPAVKFDGIDPALATLPARVTAAEGVAGRAAASIERLKTWYVPAGYAPEAGSYYRYTDGAVLAHAAYHRLPPVPVVAGEKIRVTTTVSGGATALIVWLNSDSAYVGHATRGVDGVRTEYVDHEVVVPANAAFACVTSYFAHSSTEPKLQLFGIPDPRIGAALDTRLAAVEVPVARMRQIGDRWAGKRIVWAGTSIPAGTTNAATDFPVANNYPAMIASMLGATIINTALGSSIARAGIQSAKNPAGGDPLGWTGMNWDNLWRSLAMTYAEKDELIGNWETKWRDLLTGSGKPTSLDAATQARWRGASYENKLLPNLGADLFVFDHGHNDLAVAPGGHNGTELMDRFNADPGSRDRTTFHGAINFLIDTILASNPKACILFSGHYENARKPQIALCQAAIAEFWDFPIVRLWDRVGWSQQVVTGTGASAGKTMTQVWMPDNLHPHSDATGVANMRLARPLAVALRDVF